MGLFPDSWGDAIFGPTTKIPPEQQAQFDADREAYRAHQQQAKTDTLNSLRSWTAWRNAIAQGMEALPGGHGEAKYNELMGDQSKKAQKIVTPP